MKPELIPRCPKCKKRGETYRTTKSFLFGIQSIVIWNKCTNNKCNNIYISKRKDDNKRTYSLSDTIL